MGVSKATPKLEPDFPKAVGRPKLRGLQDGPIPPTRAWERDAQEEYSLGPP